MKGFYTFITYKEDLEKVNRTIEDVAQSIVDHGGQAAYILHDKDIKEDGELVQPHYHMIGAWAKSPPDWQTFKEWMKENLCQSPGYDKAGHFHKYYKEICVGRDIDAMLHYLTHEDE